MRYVYAVISDADADMLSTCLPESLSFTNYIDVDGYFIDTGSSRRERGALLRTVEMNDQVVIESRESCGLSPEEVTDLEHRLWDKKARLTCAVETETAEEEPVETEKENTQVETEAEKPAKRRRKLRVNVDPVLFAKLYQEMKAGRIRKKEMAEKVGLSYTALLNRIQRYEQLGE